MARWTHRYAVCHCGVVIQKPSLSTPTNKASSSSSSASSKPQSASGSKKRSDDKPAASKKMKPTTATTKKKATSTKPSKKTASSKKKAASASSKSKKAASRGSGSGSGSAATKAGRTKKVYSLAGQRKDTPSELDPFRMFYESLYHERGEESEMAERWCVVHGVLDEKLAAAIVKRWGKGAGVSDGFRKRLEREAKRRKAQAQGGATEDDSDEKRDKKGEKGKAVKKEDAKVKRERSEGTGENGNDDDGVPLAKKPKKDDGAAVKSEAAVKREDDDESDDDVPLAARKG